MNTARLLAIFVAFLTLAAVRAATPKTVTADSTSAVLLWPSNFFSANSNALVEVLGTGGVIPVERGGTGGTNAAQARAAFGFDAAAPGTIGTNLVTAMTEAEVRALLAVIANSGGYATNLSVVIAGKSGPEDFTLLGAAGTNYFGFGYINDGAKMGPKLRQTGGTAAIVEDIADDDVLNYGSIIRKLPVAVDSIADLTLYDRQAAGAMVTGDREFGVFTLRTNGTMGLHLAPAYVTADTGSDHKMRLVNGMVVKAKYTGNGTGYTTGAATLTCGTNNVPVNIVADTSGGVVSVAAGWDALSTTTPMLTEIDVVQGGGSGGKVIIYEWAPADYNVDSMDITGVGSGYSTGPATVTAYGETINVTVTASGGGIVAITPDAGSKTHVGDSVTEFDVTQGGGIGGTVTLNVSEYVRYVSGGTYTTQARWKPRSIENGALIYVDITTAGAYSELPGSAHATFGRWSRDCTTAEYWPAASAPTFRAWVPGLGGTVVANGGGPGFWHRIYNGTVVPQWFGAVPDGSTDNAWPIQAAAYAAAYEKAGLYFPPCGNMNPSGWSGPPIYTDPASAGYKVTPSDMSCPQIDAQNVRSVVMDGPLYATSTAWTNSVLMVGTGTNAARDYHKMDLWITSNTAPTDKRSTAVEIAGLGYCEDFNIRYIGHFGTGIFLRPRHPVTDSKHNTVKVGEFDFCACNFRVDSRILFLGAGAEIDEWIFIGGQWNLSNPWVSGADVNWSDPVCNIDLKEGFPSEYRFIGCMFTGKGPIILGGQDQLKGPQQFWFTDCSIDSKYYIAGNPYTAAYDASVNAWYANFLFMTPTNALDGMVSYEVGHIPGAIVDGGTFVEDSPTIFWPSSWKQRGWKFNVAMTQQQGRSAMKHTWGPPVKTQAGAVAFPGALVWDMDGLTEANTITWAQVMCPGGDAFLMPGLSRTISTDGTNKIWAVEVTPHWTNSTAIRVSGMNAPCLIVQALDTSGAPLTSPQDVFGSFTYTNYTTSLSPKPYYYMAAGGDIVLSTNVARAYIGIGFDRFHTGTRATSEHLQFAPTFEVTMGRATIRGGEDIPLVPAQPDNGIAPVGSQYRDSTHRAITYNAGTVNQTTLLSGIAAGAPTTTIYVNSTAGMSVGDTVEIATDHTVSTPDDTFAAMPFTTNLYSKITAIPGAAELTISPSVTPLYDCTAGNRVRAQHWTTTGAKVASFTLTAPLNTQIVQDPVPWFAVESQTYPNGIKILDMWVKTTTNTDSYTVLLKEYSDPATSVASVESVTVSAGNYENKDNGIDNPTIEAGNLLMIDLPTTDIPCVTVEINFVPL